MAVLKIGENLNINAICSKNINLNISLALLLIFTTSLYCSQFICKIKKNAIAMPISLGYFYS